ncbi:MAG TPA: hypothetical protein VF192_09475 [Longimicrobiales bacterium]
MSMPGFFMIQEAAPALELTAGALVFMLGAMGAVTALAGWCFARILKGRRHFDPDGTGPAHSPVRGTAER